MHLDTRHMPVSLSIVGTLLCLSTAAWSATTGTLTGSKEAPRVVLENAFIQLVVEPAQGGHCTDLLYKPTGKRFLHPGTGKLQAIAPTSSCCAALKFRD